MSTNKFDNHARKKISAHETPLDTEALWDNVQAELYPKRKKKFAWIWFSASSFLIAVIAVGYFHTNTPDAITESTNTQNNPLENNKETRQNNTAVLDNTINLEQNESSANTKSGETNNFSTKGDKTSTKFEQINRAAKKTISTIKHHVNKQNTTHIGEVNNQRQSDIIETNLQTNKTTYTKKEKTQSEPNPTQTKTNAVSSPPVLLNKISPDKKETKEISENKEQASSNDQEKEMTEASNQVKEPVSTKEASSSNEVANKKIAVDDNTIEEEPAAEKSPNEIDKKVKTLRFGIGLRGGIGLSNTELSANSEDGRERFLAFRDSSETNLETIDLGIDLLLKHKSGFYLSTGLDYVRSARKLEINTEIIREDSTLGISSISIHPITLDTTSQEGFVSETSISIRNKETYNNIHMLNIPIQLGISKNYKRWEFGIQAGALLNIAIRQKGELLIGENLAFYDLSVDGENWFRDNLDLRFQGTILVGYNFTDQFQIVGGPSFRSKLSIHTDSNPVQQTQTGIGLQVAARYWW